MPNEQTPGGRFVAAALRAAIAAVVLLFAWRGLLMDTGYGNALEFSAGLLAGAATVAVLVAVCRFAARLLAPVGAGPLATLLALVLAVTYLTTTSPAELWRLVLDPDAWSIAPSAPDGLATSSIVVVVFALASVFGWFSLLRSDRRQAVPMAQVGALSALTLLLIAGALYVIVGLANDGSDPFPSDYRTFADPAPPASRPDDPSARGAHTVEAVTYGAGENARRHEFGSRRALESRTVDAAALLPEWKGIRQRMRERYWGFGLDEAPLNGSVWAPAGSGPFPLVLIVHGNHGMEEYSDPGYRYLGELLASHGLIAVSVDQNYINGSWSGDFRGKEMPLRAWLLLEHLALWRDWNADPAHRFGGRVDLSRIALVGHSRGGEALPIAYMMNGLSHYPDDATIELDYGFSIRSLVAIAQVDQRYHRRLEIDDVNFLALQGSYDSDEPAFHGLRQFNRVHLGSDAYRIKAGVYVHGANHGQFNSVWGREDTSPPYSWLLNLAPLIAAEDQQQVAKVYLSAFLQATLAERHDYLPLFRDPRVGREWLPDLAYVQQFSDSTFVPIADFEEDLDALTASAEGATITARGFATWREEELKHRDERLQGSSAVVLGWQAERPATYEVELPQAFWSAQDLADTYLSLSVSGSTEKPASDDDEPGDDEDEDQDPPDDEREPVQPEFVIEAESYDGTLRSVHSAEIAHLAPPLRVRYLKHEASNEAQYKDVWEPVLQYLEVPLDRLRPGGEAGERADIRYLRLRFEGAAPGVVIVDNIGLRHGRVAEPRSSLLQREDSL